MSEMQKHNFEDRSSQKESESTGKTQDFVEINIQQSSGDPLLLRLTYKHGCFYVEEQYVDTYGTIYWGTSRVSFMDFCQHYFSYLKSGEK